jgi:acetyl esterase/lipase
MPSRRASRCLTAVVLLGLLARAGAAAPPTPLVIDLWPGQPPGEAVTLEPEADRTKPQDPLVAGRRVARIGNVSTPQLHVYRPAAEADTGAAVIICPGGAHAILAWDLEGTEVAEWLTSVGVTGIVLKYRVPGRPKDRRWLAAVQDAQRAVRVVRSRAAEWRLDPERLGICGFSAGGEVAARTALADAAFYEPVDAVDDRSCRPDFALLVYPAFLVDKNAGAPRLKPDLVVTKDAPEMFFVHAANDGVTPQSSLLLAAALHQAGVPAELHLYPTGGHGYGLRHTAEPVTRWNERAAAWLAERGWLKSRPAPAQKP